MIVKTLVAGAGPCGLGAAERLTELGDEEWTLVDASIEPKTWSWTPAQVKSALALTGLVRFE